MTSGSSAESAPTRITANTIRITRYHDALLFENAKPHHFLFSPIVSLLLLLKCPQLLPGDVFLEFLLVLNHARYGVRQG